MGTTNKTAEITMWTDTVRLTQLLPPPRIKFTTKEDTIPNPCSTKSMKTTNSMQNLITRGVLPDRKT